MVSLINEFDNNRYRDMDRFTTLFLYTCRIIYEDGRAEGDSHHIVKTDTSTVVEKCVHWDYWKKGKPPPIKDRIIAQRTLSRFNIIQKMETNAWSADGNGILIYSSILNVIPNPAINSMYEQLEELKLVDKNDMMDEREESE